jgi:hypothetical protein
MPIQGTFSARKALSIGIDSPIVGLTANDSTKLIFSTQTPNGGVSPVYIRSTTCWAKNIDLSPLSPWNSSGNTQEGGTLISPRHIVFANHFTIPNGSTLIFVDMNNNSYTRTLSNQAQVGSTDIQIGILNSDLPSNVTFCKVASFSLSSLAPVNTISNYAIPVLYTDQEEKALIGEFYNTGNTDLGGNLQYAGGLFTPVDSQRASFYETPISGDSGDPIGFVYNNKLILLFTFYSAYFGPNLGYYLNEINSVMTSLGGGYTLSLFTENDLKGNNKIQNPSLSYLEPLYINNQSTEIYNPNNTYIFQGGSVNTISTVFNIQDFTGGGTISTADLLVINNVIYYRKTGAGAGWKTAAGADATNTVINIGEIIYLRYYNNLAGGRSVNSGAIIQRQNYGKFSIR